MGRQLIQTNATQMVGLKAASIASLYQLTNALEGFFDQYGNPVVSMILKSAVLGIDGLKTSMLGAKTYLKNER